jgi:hypothetical protein
MNDGDSRLRLQTGLAAFIYLGLSLVYWGRALLPHFSQRYLALGSGADSTISMWSIAWWPHAIARGINPFITRVVWPPSGYNLVWTTSIPGPSLLWFPVTDFFGPVVTYNILCLLCPAAAALFSFILCRYLSGCFWPALLGGYIFGFSPYVLSHIMNHLCLLFIFSVPLIIYLVLLRLDRLISGRVFLPLLVCVLIFHFLSSEEIFATTSLFGTIALVACYLASTTPMRSRYFSLVKEIAGAYLLLTVFLSPFIYYVFFQGVPKQFSLPENYSNDLLAFLVATPVVLGTYLTGSSLGQRLLQATHWQGQAAYLGPGIWVVLFLFGWSNWRAGRARVLVPLGMFGIIALMSLGPELRVSGHSLITMPWAIFDKLPLIRQALPGRFGMYLFLIAGIVTSMYLSSANLAAWLKLLIGAACVLFIAPNLSAIRFVAVDTPMFFRTGMYRRYIGKDENVLILPMGVWSNNLLWQAQTGFAFELAAARLGQLAPPEFISWPVLSAFDANEDIIDFPEQFESFLGANRVRAVIVDSREPGPWPGLLGKCGLAPISVGGVLLYRVPSSILRSFASADAKQMARRAAEVSFGLLIKAAAIYLNHGFALARLTPREVEQSGFLHLPADTDGSFGASSVRTNWWRNLWLGAWDGSMVGVGIMGNYETLEPLIREYTKCATEVFFPFPSRFTGKHDRKRGQLLMVFPLDGIQRCSNQQP